MYTTPTPVLLNHHNLLSHSGIITGGSVLCLFNISYSALNTLYWIHLFFPWFQDCNPFIQLTNEVQSIKFNGHFDTPPKGSTTSQMAACPTGFRISTTPSKQVLLSYGNSLSAGTLWYADPADCKSYQQLSFYSLSRWIMKSHCFNTEGGCSTGTVDNAGQVPRSQKHYLQKAKLTALSTSKLICTAGRWCALLPGSH